jgi:hypothetical protein
MWAMIKKKLATTDPHVCSTFLLVYGAGYTEAEAALEQGIPLGTVASRLRRVRSRLKDAFCSGTTTYVGERAARRYGKRSRKPGINLPGCTD